MACVLWHTEIKNGIDWCMRIPYSMPQIVYSFVLSAWHVIITWEVLVVQQGSIKLELTFLLKLYSKQKVIIFIHTCHINSIQLCMHHWLINYTTLLWHTSTFHNMATLSKSTCYVSLHKYSCSDMQYISILILTATCM